MEGNPLAIKVDPLWALTLSAPFSGHHPLPSATLNNSGCPKPLRKESNNVELKEQETSGASETRDMLGFL
jgi:hypothetical protein